jgi:hypothetical protein
MSVMIDTLIAPLIVGFLLFLYHFGNMVTHSSAQLWIAMILAFVTLVTCFIIGKGEMIS